MLMREQDKGAQWVLAAPLPPMRVSLQCLHSVSLVSITLALSPPPCGAHRPFQLSVCPSECWHPGDITVQPRILIQRCEVNQQRDW